MTKAVSKLEIVTAISTVVWLTLMFSKNEVDILSKEYYVFTASALGDGVFFSMGDFLTYNAFIISAVLTIFSLSISITKFFRK